MLHPYTINSVIVSRVNMIKDLRVWLDSGLTIWTTNLLALCILKPLVRDFSDPVYLKYL